MDKECVLKLIVENNDVHFFCLFKLYSSLLSFMFFFCCCNKQSPHNLWSLWMFFGIKLLSLALSAGFIFKTFRIAWLPFTIKASKVWYNSPVHVRGLFWHVSKNVLYFVYLMLYKSIIKMSWCVNNVNN